MKAAIENPKIKPFVNKIITLNMIPKSAIPKSQTTKIYSKFIEMLFLKAIKLSIELLLILFINNVILSITIFLSFKPIIPENTAPAITPKNKIHMTKILIFLFGRRMLLTLLYFLINDIT